MGPTTCVLTTALAIFVTAGCATANQGSVDAGPNDQVDASPTPTVDAGCGNFCDADNDGVVDGNDECPDTPAGEPVNQSGCSDSQATTTLEPDFPPYGLTWVDSGDPGRAGGLTWTYTAISRGDLFHIYWILCDDPTVPCGISLNGPIDDASEYWSYSAADSDLANGILVFTNAPVLLHDDGSTETLSGRMTVTITDLNDVPIPAGDVTALAVPARSGEAGAEIPGTMFKVHLLCEVQDTTNMTWTPYADYYDAASTPMAGDTLYSSISGYFYSR